MARQAQFQHGPSVPFSEYPGTTTAKPFSVGVQLDTLSSCGFPLTQATQKQVALIAVAGPLFSVFVGLACLVVYRRRKDRPSWLVFLILARWENLTGGLPTDGAGCTLELRPKVEM